VAAYLAGGPTGPSGMYQAAGRPSPLLQSHDDVALHKILAINFRFPYSLGLQY